MRAWVRPVSEPAIVTSSAAAHLQRSDLCGIDYISNSDTHMRAMAAGIIEYAHARLGLDPYNYDTLGHFIVIRHDIDGVPVWSRMCHAESLQQTRGEVVPGWPVGIYGNTGFSQGPHVHVDFWARIKDLPALPEGAVSCTKVVPPWPTCRGSLINIDMTNFLVKEFQNGLSQA